MNKASLKIIKLPYTDGYGIAWDGKTVASSCLAAVMNEAANNPYNRERFLGFLNKALKPDATDHWVHSGNGPNLMVVNDYAFLDHDYFEDQKAFMRLDEIFKTVAWIETLEELGFPMADIEYPTHEFNFIADGPTAEAEFRLASQFRGSTAFG
ncbi:hypothetical protein MWU61_19175 [Loktanella sp. F6476L]|uniref:hypothetical protein n=1 Tax=Loktanella sp. F6476L TaxID=2926405 RepID=UPI001FF29A5F|nr:hypothetical protein [Loktanella sp. F6476L]MCK0122678.1 hypothetical protein [Loktanella sp. F6476L]